MKPRAIASYFNVRTYQNCILFFGVLLVAAAIGGLMGCGNSNQKKSAQSFFSGDFTDAVERGEIWEKQSPDAPAPKFMMSVSYYFLGDFEKASQLRDAWIKSPDSTGQVKAWLSQTPAYKLNEWVAEFVNGVLAESESNREEAIKCYRAAWEKNPENELIGNNLSSLENDSEFEMKIPKEDKITMTGTMWLENERFLPVDPEEEKDADFKITGGSLLSRLGNLSLTSGFNKWAYIEDKSSGKRVGWAAMLTSGKIITKTAFANVQEASDKQRQLSIKCKFMAQPFDYMGKYVVIDLDKDEDESFPMARFASSDEVLLLLGADFILDPDPYRDAAGYFGGHSLRMAISEGSISGMVEPYHFFKEDQK